MTTPYSGLSEREKESDRKVVREFMQPALCLTRALLESQGELFDALESEHESEFMGINGCTQSRPGRQCRRCELLNRAAKVRKGEV